MKLFKIVISYVFLTLLFATYYFFYTPGTNSKFENNLLTASETNLENRLNKHICVLSEEIGERHYLAEGSLQKTADYIHTEFSRLNSDVSTIEYGENKQYKIVSIKLQGKSNKPRSIIIGAHYDTVPLTLGADDNASGIAALIELASELKNESLKHNLIFVGFPNEEAPFYGTGLMGSYVYARSLNKIDVIGMISLEMLGFYSYEKNSQEFPFPLQWFYPDTASFIAFVGNLKSRQWLHQSIKSYREHAKIPAEGLTAPEILVPDISRSDQLSFWQQGIPAFMITDTAEYRSPHYHFADDIIETLDTQTMTKVVVGLKAMLMNLANMDYP